MADFLVAHGDVEAKPIYERDIENRALRAVNFPDPTKPACNLALDKAKSPPPGRWPVSATGSADARSGKAFGFRSGV